jgi:hypothetical protein
MFAKAETFQQILVSLSVLRYVIASNCKRGLTDIAIEAEDFLCALVNITRGWDLRNLNYEEKNFPAIDLGSESVGVGVQVTADNSASKIDETLSTFYDKKLDQKYPNLIVLILTSKKSYRKYFAVDKLQSFDIWDLDDILFHIESMPENPDNALRFQAIEGLIRRELPSIVSALAPETSLLSQLEVIEGRPATTAASFMNFLRAEKQEQNGIIEDIHALYSRLQSDTYRYFREFLFASIKFTLDGSEFLKRFPYYPECMSESSLICNLDHVVRRLRVSYPQGCQLQDELHLLGFATRVEAHGFHSYTFIWHPSTSLDGNIIYYLKLFVADDMTKLRRILVNLEFDLLD